MKRVSLILILFLVMLLALAAFHADRTAAEKAPDPEPPAASPEVTLPATSPEETPEPASLSMGEPPLAPEPDYSLLISEVMSHNRATLPGAADSFPDWVELLNTGAEAVSLAGLRLQCGEKSWELPEQTVLPGKYVLLLCEENTDFSIPSEGESLSLLSARGTLIDRAELPALASDTVWTPEGISAWPSPGFENSPAGYEAFQSGRTVEGLVISEAVVYDAAGDWVEIVNLGDQNAQLEGWVLSDKLDRAENFTFPEWELGPMESVRVQLPEDSFSLNAQRDRLYLFDPQGKLQDFVSLHDIPLGGSMGRMMGAEGFWYFAEATPGDENLDGFRRVSAEPVSLEPDGVFDGVKSVKVTLSAPGEIRYTTDGSIPTEESELYTGPISLSETTVIRAVCFEKDALPSRALSLSYFLNEGHSLPVVSLVSDPEGLFGGDRGIYSNPELDEERFGAVMFYDGEEGFSLDCGVELHGATSRINQPKKSLKLRFRSRYDGELHYDLFENGVTDFASILLRAPQEPGYSSLLRDALMHELASEAFPALPVQDSRYAVLYLNGEYWGVYSIREVHSPETYAYHHGLDPDMVYQYRGKWGPEAETSGFYGLALNSDLSNQENYRKVAEHVDIDSVIGWAVIQAYCGNTDLHSDNMRFYYTAGDDVLHYALVDVDHGMEDVQAFDCPITMGYKYNKLFAALLNSGEFRARLISQMEKAFSGVLKEENVVAKIDEMAALIRPEMPRDRERWGAKMSGWESLVQGNKNYFLNFGGRTSLVRDSLKNYIGATPEWRDYYYKPKES